MDVRIISIVLVIAIVICILALIAISVIPAKKKSSVTSKEPKKPKEPKEPAKTSESAKIEETKEPAKTKEPLKEKEIAVADKSAAEKEEVKVSALKADTQKPSKVDVQENEIAPEDTKKIQESVKNPEPVAKPGVKSSSGSLNPPRKNPPKENTTQTTEQQNEITRFKSFSNKDACMALLSLIAEEYSKQQPKKDEVVINYLKDDALELVCDHGIFYLNNEEIFLNGNMLEDTHVYVITAGKRVIIRFGVNFSLPEGYELSLCSNDAMLAKKGLQLVSANENTRNSLRVSLVSTKECTITKTDHLFYVKIMKELIQ